MPQAEAAQRAMQGREARVQAEAALQFGPELGERDVRRRRDQAARGHPRAQPEPAADGPPTCAGAALPVSLTRRSSLIAADALTSKRLAAARIELPPATARTIRSRKSIDIGAGIRHPSAAPTDRVESLQSILHNRKMV